MVYHGCGSIVHEDAVIGVSIDRTAGKTLVAPVTVALASEPVLSINAPLITVTFTPALPLAAVLSMNKPPLMNTFAPVSSGAAQVTVNAESLVTVPVPWIGAVLTPPLLTMKLPLLVKPPDWKKPPPASRFKIPRVPIVTAATLNGTAQRPSLPTTNEP